MQYVKRTARVVSKRETWHARQIRCSRVRMGNHGARWCVCPTNLSAESVVYSFGIGEDISFDLELIDRFGVKVHAFDPTPRSLAWLRSQTLPQAFMVHEFGVADYDGTCTFFPPASPLHVSHSAVERRSGVPAIEAQVLRLTTIMQNLGHNAIHLLKMDIEGAEYAVLSDLLQTGIRVDQLLVEFHHRWQSVGIEKTRAAIRDLNLAGYYIFNVSPSGEEYSFKGQGT
jgi:FkbM family methyltransferase